MSPSLSYFAKAHLLPNAEKTIKIWREVAQKHQMELYLALFEHTGYNIPEYLSKGFDMSINFQPFCMGKFQHCKMLFKHGNYTIITRTPAR